MYGDHDRGTGAWGGMGICGQNGMVITSDHSPGSGKMNLPSQIEPSSCDRSSRMRYSYPPDEAAVTWNVSSTVE